MKYNIDKDGRYGKITPVPEGRLGLVLEKELSYTKQGAQFMSNPLWAIVKLYKIRNGRFPIGLTEKVKSIFESWIKLGNKDEYEFRYDFRDNLDPEKLKLLNPDLREYQKDAILRLILNGGGIISLPTGAGKTFVAVEYIKYMNFPTLVVVHTLDLKKQWEKQVPANVDVKTYQSIKDKKILDNYKLVIMDECHHVSAKLIYNIAMFCDNAVLVGLSATPFREDGEDMKIRAALGDIVYSINKKILIDNNFLCNAKIKYVKLNNYSKDKLLTYHDIYDLMVVYNEERNNEIIKLIKNHKENKILVLVSRIDHGNIIVNKLDIENIKYLYLTGDVKDREFDDNEKLIIATTIWDEGVDIPDFDILILAAGGKSAIKVTQRVGRVLRYKKDKTPIVYDFIDKSRYLLQHYKKRRNILEQDFEVEEID